MSPLNEFPGQHHKGQLTRLLYADSSNIKEIVGQNV